MSTDPARWSPGTWVKKRIVDAYLRHIQKNAAMQTDEIRRLQLESGRTKEQIMRVEVYEKDVKMRGVIDQALFLYRFRLRDGHPEILEGNGVAYDMRVITDVPTLLGFMDGKINRVFPDGTTRTLQPFKPMDALRIGTLETEGGSALRNLTLLEKTVFPQLAEMLKFKPGVA